MEWHGLQKQAAIMSRPKKKRIYVRLTLCVILCRVHVTFIDKEGLESTFAVAEGDNLLDIAQSEDIEMEGMYFTYLLGVFFF